MNSSKRISASRWATITNLLYPNYPRQVIKVPVLAIFILIVTSLISGCVTLNDPEASQEFRADVVGKVTGEDSIGQTFVSRRENLNNIQIWYFLNSDKAPQSGNLTAKIFHSPEDEIELRSYTVSFSQLASSNTLTIPFNIQGGTPNQSYYLELQINSGELGVYGRNEDSYPHGQTFLNRSPLNSDISFRLSYEYDLASLVDDIKLIINMAYLIIPLLLFLWVPGRLILDLLPIRHNLDMVERIALSIGISMAFTPILLLWTSTLNLSLQRGSVILFFGLVALIYIWLKRNTLRQFILKPKLVKREQIILPLGILVVFGFVLITRIAMVRDMAAPAWVDSVHHALIADQIINQGQYPETYSPLIQIEPATYHPGFHSLVAVFHWLTGLQIHIALLIMGQVLNTLMILGVYLFAKTLTRSSLAGFFAALISGLMTPMPAYYTSWGRYTQLAGLLILPSVFTLVVWILDETKRNNATLLSKQHWQKTFPSIFVVGMTLAGLYLTHYRVSAFIVSLLGIYLLVMILANIKQGKTLQRVAYITGAILFIFIISLILTAPWWPNALSSLILPRLASGTGPAKLFSDFSWYYLTTALGMWAMILAGLGAILGLLQREKSVIMLILWVGTLFFFANLSALNLPGGQFINNTSVTIMLFIPISLMAGYLIASILLNINNWLRRPWRHFFQVGVSLSVLVVMVIGAQAILPILNPITILFREADLQAMDWIEENIPENQVIMINPFSWGYGMYAGSDGGYWISPLASRPTMPPPVLYGLNQELGSGVVKISSEVVTRSDDVDSLYQYLSEHNIEYIYIGARGGALSPKSLDESPKYQTLYNFQNTWVFQLESSPKTICSERFAGVLCLESITYSK